MLFSPFALFLLSYSAVDFISFSFFPFLCFPFCLHVTFFFSFSFPFLFYPLFPQLLLFSFHRFSTFHPECSIFSSLLSSFLNHSALSSCTCYLVTVAHMVNTLHQLIIIHVGGESSAFLLVMVHDLCKKRLDNFLVDLVSMTVCISLGSIVSSNTTCEPI